MDEQNQDKNIKYLLFLLAGSKFLSSIVIFSFYISSNDLNYLPIALILFGAGLGIIYLYLKKVKNRK